ncbi:hypothetical protein AQUCO_04100030v1 [Aquilegia coerulea]|uniref:F-box domain-containing protein n=1 Tax=Aquilegia coerulea TaxID=218851 RepID=A0A2G5CQ09_AQUCA|nr:hypothetical protein AQUCO_04100030v1 [Aquilegia coerulea]PIA33330.1 hypothetical protein AQUCO_04100030v1 [Aquilegia coerulea]
MAKKSLSLNLPAEVVIEILSWLPIKSISRFRCVSKFWHHLLTKDIHFTKLYQDRCNKNPGILVIRREFNAPNDDEEEDIIILSDSDEDEEEEEEILGDTKEIVKFYCAIDLTACNESIELDSSYLPSFCYIYGICNGLVCLADDEYNFCIWNPLLKDHVVIPCLPSSSHFPGCDEVTSAGFGYNQDTNQCIVITFCIIDRKEAGYMSHVSLYTLGRDSAWRTIEGVPYFVDSHATPINGALHWLAFTQSLTLILSFNMNDEVFQEIPPPNDVRFDVDGEYNHDMKIGELGGLLSIFIQPTGENVQIWVLREYAEVHSWTKTFVIGQLDLYPLGATHEEEIILHCKSAGQLILYNPRTYSVRNEEFGFEFHDAFIFIGSILSPTLIRGARDTFT